ncbi:MULTISPECIES: hypothetical protein [unclassified Aureispira]|uniref:hypothetical protein n=1 Tax=unclassified Aureispira TaxID=2649989 RepID=UPI000696E101|nr:MULTISPECIES: hypothetical protein [unclassified Aureispira]WMX16606.1 hypothetical protein QP953_09530 [Aureispira sp. CCB-E]
MDINLLKNNQTIVKTLEQDSEILGALEVAIKKDKEWFLQTIKTIQDENVSNYPILVAFPSFTTVNIGLPIVEGEKLSFNATTLEELAMKKVVSLEKIDEFRKLYKEKKNSFCIFLLEKPAPQFIFIPV